MEPAPRCSVSEMSGEVTALPTGKQVPPLSTFDFGAFAGKGTA
jgi:hypothetical protein